MVYNIRRNKMGDKVQNKKKKELKKNVVSKVVVPVEPLAAQRKPKKK